MLNVVIMSALNRFAVGLHVYFVLFTPV